MDAVLHAELVAEFQLTGVSSIEYEINLNLPCLAILYPGEQMNVVRKT